MLPQLRVYWLASRASHWAWTIGMSSNTRRFGEPDPLREIETHMFGAHMCVLALRHLHRCLEHLQTLDAPFPVRTRKLVNSFMTAYNASSITAARHALEHEEDRVAGLHMDRHAGMRYDGDYPDPHITGSNSRSGRLTMIRVLDKDFELSNVIAAALALEDPLNELARSIWENPGGQNG
jgi:hypothetical protein